MPAPWQKEVEEFCRRFDIPIEYLADTLSDPKVIPMIRGKAFRVFGGTSTEKRSARRRMAGRKTDFKCSVGIEGHRRESDTQALVKSYPR